MLEAHGHSRRRSNKACQRPAKLRRSLGGRRAPLRRGGGGGPCACARACLPATGWGERRGGSCDVRCARGSGCAGTAGASEGGGRADGRGVLVAGRVTLRSSSRRRAPLHHVRPAGALRARLARARWTISGTAGRAGPPGPATLLPEVQLLPLPSPPARAAGIVRAAERCSRLGPGGGGPHGPAPSHLTALQFFIHLGRRVEAGVPPPSHRLFAPRTSFAAESWSSPLRGSSRHVHVGEA